MLVSSAWKGKTNIMTMGWHMVMGFSPSLIGCYIWDENHSFEMIRRSKQCVINIPTTDLINEAVGIGNCSGRRSRQVREVPPHAGMPAEKVDAPLIQECYANFECRLFEGRLVSEMGPVHLGGGEGPRGDLAQVPQNLPLPRRRHLHDLRPLHQPPQEVQARDAVTAADVTTSDRECRWEGIGLPSR